MYKEKRYHISYHNQYWHHTVHHSDTSFQSVNILTNTITLLWVNVFSSSIPNKFIFSKLICQHINWRILYQYCREDKKHIQTQLNQYRKDKQGCCLTSYTQMTRNILKTQPNITKKKEAVVLPHTYEWHLDV